PIAAARDPASRDPPACAAPSCHTSFGRLAFLGRGNSFTTEARRRGSRALPAKRTAVPRREERQVCLLPAWEPWAGPRGRSTRRKDPEEAARGPPPLFSVHSSMLSVPPW